MSWIRRLSHLGTHVMTSFTGRQVGADADGNRYYEEKQAAGRRPRRWVIYAGEPEASTVPPAWHGWLHYTMVAPLAEDSPFQRPWQQPHQPNLTGSDAAYLPPGHTARAGQRPPATGDYEAWQP